MLGVRANYIVFPITGASIHFSDGGGGGQE